MDVWLHPVTLHSLLDFRCAACLHALNTFLTLHTLRRHEGRSLLADDVEGKLSAAFPGLSQDKAAFLDSLKLSALDTAQLGQEVSISSGEPAQPIRVFHAPLASATPALKASATACTPQWQAGERHAAQPGWVQELHRHLEPLLLFFVDGASAIDTSDPAWQLLIAVRDVDGRPTVVRTGAVSCFPELQRALRLVPFCCKLSQSCAAVGGHVHAVHVLGLARQAALPGEPGAGAATLPATGRGASPAAGCLRSCRRSASPGHHGAPLLHLQLPCYSLNCMQLLQRVSS